MRRRPILSAIMLIAFLLASTIPTGARAEERMIFENSTIRSLPNTIMFNKSNPSGDVILRFGGTLNEQLRWEFSTHDFILTDDLRVQGTLSGSSLKVGGGKVSVSADGTSIFNVHNEKVNFRIASFNQTNMFFVDGTYDRIGIGTSAPETDLEIAGTASGEHFHFGRLLTGSGNMKIQTTTDSIAALQVFDADGGNPVLAVDTEHERVGIGTATPRTALEVAGTISGAALRISTLAASGALVYSSGSSLANTATGSSGSLLISQGTAAPKWANPVGGMVWYLGGTQEAGTAKGARVRIPLDLTLTGVTMDIAGAPTGAALIADINKNGTSIFSTKPQIAAGAVTGGSNAVFAETSLPLDSIVTIDIDQVGSVFAGSGLTINLRGIRKY